MIRNCVGCRVTGTTNTGPSLLSFSKNYYLVRLGSGRRDKDAVATGRTGLLAAGKPPRTWQKETERYSSLVFTPVYSVGVNSTCSDIHDVHDMCDPKTLVWIPYWLSE
jgi:hypothetical protein